MRGVVVPCSSDNREADAEGYPKICPCVRRDCLKESSDLTGTCKLQSLLHGVEEVETYIEILAFTMEEHI